ncbi:sigma-70 family RNA polymerase sigma factor [Pseudonocardiaceae bacterium YIM PH 21723]|nr:sigma-70 family RNA polymerase sigma factor [Pseudonocardiaceae bacterium YIM PH 21723]
MWNQAVLKILTQCGVMARAPVCLPHSHTWRCPLSLTEKDLAVAPASSDEELINMVRSGDTEAFGTLYERHVTAARRLASQLARSAAEADDLVSEAFTKTLHIMRAGGGPQSSFRPYLLATVRNSAYERFQHLRRVVETEDFSHLTDLKQPADLVFEGLERSLVAKAFARLPERWQMVLWHTAVEGQSPAAIAELLGATPNSVSAMAYRAREGLRQEYLQVHLAQESVDQQCRNVVARLGAWARDGLSRRERSQVEAHLDTCDSCRALATDLRDLNGSFRAIVAPMILGAAAVGYLSSSSAGTSAVAGTAVSSSVTAGITAAASTAALCAAVVVGSFADPATEPQAEQVAMPPKTTQMATPPAAMQEPVAQGPASLPSFEVPAPPAPKPVPLAVSSESTHTELVDDGAPEQVTMTVTNPGSEATTPEAMTFTAPAGVKMAWTDQDLSPLAPGESRSYKYWLSADQGAESGTITGRMGDVELPAVPVTVAKAHDLNTVTGSTSDGLGKSWITITVTNTGKRAGTASVSVTPPSGSIFSQWEGGEWVMGDKGVTQSFLLQPGETKTVKAFVKMWLGKSGAAKISTNLGTAAQEFVEFLGKAK